MWKVAEPGRRTTFRVIKKVTNNSSHQRTVVSSKEQVVPTTEATTVDNSTTPSSWCFSIQAIDSLSKELIIDYLLTSSTTYTPTKPLFVYLVSDFLESLTSSPRTRQGKNMSSRLFATVSTCPSHIGLSFACPRVFALFDAAIRSAVSSSNGSIGCASALVENTESSASATSDSEDSYFVFYHSKQTQEPSTAGKRVKTYSDSLRRHRRSRRNEGANNVALEQQQSSSSSASAQKPSRTPGGASLLRTALSQQNSEKPINNEGNAVSQPEQRDSVYSRLALPTINIPDSNSKGPAIRPVPHGHYEYVMKPANGSSDSSSSHNSSPSHSVRFPSKPDKVSNGVAGNNDTKDSTNKRQKKKGTAGRVTGLFSGLKGTDTAVTSDKDELGLFRLKTPTTASEQLPLPTKTSVNNNYELTPTRSSSVFWPKSGSGQQVVDSDYVDDLKKPSLATTNMLPLPVTSSQLKQAGGLKSKGSILSCFPFKHQAPNMERQSAENRKAGSKAGKANKALTGLNNVISPTPNDNRYIQLEPTKVIDYRSSSRSCPSSIVAEIQ